MIEQRLPQIQVVRDRPPIFESARATKDKSELEIMRGVANDTVDCLQQIFSGLRDCRERDGIVIDPEGEVVTVGRVKSELRSCLAAHNLRELHETILGQGREAGIPHASNHDDTPLRTGVATVFDIFPSRGGGGYFFDITRSFTIGHADQEFEKLYSCVYDAQLAAIAEARVGMHGSELQKLACDHFEDAGHPTVRTDPDTTSGYVHSLGHGIGLEVHEAPFLRLQEVPDERNRLFEGSVFTIEPGLYYPERGLGVRLEDVVFLNSEGRAEILAEFPKFNVLELKG